MSDLAKWKLRGPVRTVRTEIAEWDAERETWKAPRHLTVLAFDPHGKISTHDSHGLDGSVFRTAYRYHETGRLEEVEHRMGESGSPVTRLVHAYDDAGRHVRTVSVALDGSTRESERCHYDSTGRKTKVTVLDVPTPGVAVMFGIEGTDQSVGAPGATAMTTTYDDRDLPQEVLLHDAQHALVRRVTFNRDREGRVLSEDVQFGGTFPFPEIQQTLGARSEEEVRNVTAMLTSVFARQTLNRTSYVYDRHGRVLERSMIMGALGESRTTFRYDDRDNPIEETTEKQQREIGADANGTWRARKESRQRQSTRFDYQYDAAGNWTERIVSSRTEATVTFLQTNVERRQISYYAR